MDRLWSADTAPVGAEGSVGLIVGNKLDVGGSRLDAGPGAVGADGGEQ
jgi:hypothetical protein